MTTKKTYALPFLCALLLGCGGQGSTLGSGGNNGNPGPFTGTYVGTVTGNGNIGSMVIMISNIGTVSGSDTLSGPGTSDTVTGTITSNGGMLIFSRNSAGTTARISVGVTVGSNGSLSGTGTETVNGTTTTFTLQLSKQTV